MVVMMHPVFARVTIRYQMYLHRSLRFRTMHRKNTSVKLRKISTSLRDWNRNCLDYFLRIFILPATKSCEKLISLAGLPTPRSDLRVTTIRWSMES